MLLVSAVRVKEEENRFKGCNSSLYLLGKFDPETCEFRVEHSDEIDCGHDFYAPQTCSDGEGRRIMVAWMGNFNPLIMAAVSLFIIFLSRGMAQVCTDFGYTSEALSDTVIGIIYFFFIACEFFIRYKVHINNKKIANIFRPKKKSGGKGPESRTDPPEEESQEVSFERAEDAESISAKQEQCSANGADASEICIDGEGN